MPFDLLLVREGTQLGAAEPISAEIIEGLKHGDIFTAIIKRSRNPKHHRKLFALIGIVFAAQTSFATTKQLLDAIKLATGLFDTGKTIDGIPFATPRSISFAAMGQKEFEEWYDKVVELVVNKIIPGLNREDLEMQVHEMVGK